MQNYVTIKENKDFKRLYFRGKSFVDPTFVMYVAKGRKGKIRLGITAGKKLGCAVNRNRAKRVIRAAFADVSPNIQKGYDFVFVARTRILNEKSNTVANGMKKQLKAAGVLVEIPSDKQFADKSY